MSPNLESYTPEYRALNRYWGIVQSKPHDPDWENFDIFADYCIENGWRLGLSITRPNPSKPWGPDNCDIGGRQRSAEEQQSINRWDATVAKIRRAYGLPPL